VNSIFKFSLYNRSRWEHALLGGKILLTSIILTLVFLKIDLNILKNYLTRVQPVFLLLAVGHLCLIAPLGGFRWKLVLSSIGLTSPNFKIMRTFWIGMLFNQILPTSSGGDSVRILIAWRSGVSIGSAASSVIIERILMLVTLICLVAVIQPFFWQIDFFNIRWVLPLTVAIVFVVIFIIFSERLILNLPTWLPFRILLTLLEDARSVCKSRSIFLLILVCLVTHVNFAIASYWIGLSLNLSLNFLYHLFFVSIVSLVTILPISVGGWGLREGAFMVLFGAVGVSEHQSVALSILLGLCVILSSLPALMFWWQYRLNEKT